MEYIVFKPLLINDDTVSGPDLVKIYFNLELIKRIKLINKIVCENEFASIKEYSFVKYLTQTNNSSLIEDYHNDIEYMEYENSIQNSCVEVDDKMFWWTGRIRHSDIVVQTETLDMEELLKIEIFLTRIVNNNLGCSITSIVNEIIDTIPDNIKETFVLLNNDKDSFIMGPYLAYGSIMEYIRNLERVYISTQTFSIITVDNENVIRIQPCDT
jgi:hypothetical protein